MILTAKKGENEALNKAQTSPNPSFEIVKRSENQFVNPLSPTKNISAECTPVHSSETINSSESTNPIVRVPTPNPTTSKEKVSFSSFLMMKKKFENGNDVNLKSPTQARIPRKRMKDLVKITPGKRKVQIKQRWDRPTIPKISRREKQVLKVKIKRVFGWDCTPRTFFGAFRY